ncbi:AI-2E family transporter [Thiorhodococcus minor]|uniref:AI-2E family transporter n=1 Tax=Thiorhodococcus minor TaxID=57489 RepID=A0A6M0K488_9GAMM|nr:AI-2E family transporter [Thiorhodococcus minor]NEV64084.1 AI-2E family transporter [Thiorhodococcus minor]
MSESDRSFAFSPSARFLLVAAAFVVVVAGLKAAATLVTPFLLAVFIAVVVQPPMRFLRRRGLPGWAALLLVVVMIVGIGGAMVGLFTTSLNEFNASLPEYQARLKVMNGEAVRWLDHLGVHISRDVLTSMIDPAGILGLASDLIKGLGAALANAFLILLTVVFILMEANSLPSKLRVALRAPDASLRHLRQVLETINGYMFIKAITSLATGLLVWLWLRFLGVDFAAMWATLAFLLNFVPTIGSIIAAIPAVLLALVQLGLESAVLVAAGYLLVNVVIGSVIEPRVMGRGLGLSTLVVFVSLVFWGYVLGSAGMFLSVPLTMALKIALSSNPQTRPIAIMLGPEVEARHCADATRSEPGKGGCDSEPTRRHEPG